MKSFFLPSLIFITESVFLEMSAQTKPLLLQRKKNEEKLGKSHFFVQLFLWWLSKNIFKSTLFSFLRSYVCAICIRLVGDARQRNGVQLEQKFVRSCAILVFNLSSFFNATYAFRNIFIGFEENYEKVTYCPKTVQLETKSFPSGLT